MTSQAVLAAQPKSASDAFAKIEAGARETRAEAPPEKVWGEVSAKRSGPKHHRKIVPSRNPSTTKKTNSTGFPSRAISASFWARTRTMSALGHKRTSALVLA